MAAAVGALGIGTTLAGGVLGAQGAMQSAAATQQMYNYQAGVARINSQIDLQNADYARQQGEIQAQQYGQKAAQQLGAIRTVQAASGVDVNTGTAAQVQESQKKVAGVDIGMIRQNAAKTAYDYDVKSTMDLNQSTLDTMAGVNAIAAGKIQAETSILGAVSSVSSKWLQASQMGMFSGGGTMPASNVGIG